MKEEADKKQEKGQNQQQKLDENGQGEDPEDSPLDKEERFQQETDSKDSSDDSSRQGNEDETDNTADREPLQSDGSEDEEALERILEEMEKDTEETEKNVAASDQGLASSYYVEYMWCSTGTNATEERMAALLADTNRLVIFINYQIFTISYKSS